MILIQLKSNKKLLNEDYKNKQLTILLSHLKIKMQCSIKCFTGSIQSDSIRNYSCKVLSCKVACAQNL